METLRAYLDSDLDVARTADALYVHPNTVRYRLRRVSELTGYSPTVPRDALALRLALIFDRLGPPDPAP